MEYDQRIVLERGFEGRVIMNIVNGNNEAFDVNIPFVRDAILYYTIQQYFNNNDKKTCEFIHQIEETHGFSFQNGLKMNIPLLSKLLNTTDKELYARYGMVKKSFANLTNDVILVKKGDQAYSKLLATTKEAPPYLFLKGNVHLLEEKSVCVVGSRNASEESMKKTERIVKSLVKRNIVVNAGLARGIDTATHTAALANGGRTIAVIGTPINQYCPKENKNLQIQIEKNGLVVSQFPPCNAINRWNFPTSIPDQPQQEPRLRRFPLLRSQWKEWGLLVRKAQTDSGRLPLPVLFLLPPAHKRLQEYPPDRSLAYGTFLPVS